MAAARGRGIARDGRVRPCHDWLARSLAPWIRYFIRELLRLSEMLVSVVLREQPIALSFVKYNCSEKCVGKNANKVDMRFENIGLFRSSG